MALTNLAGTTWRLKDALYSYAPYTSYTQISIETSVPLEKPTTGTEQSFVGIKILYNTEDNRNAVEFVISSSVNCIAAYGHDTRVLPDTYVWAFDGTFTITGGADATNPHLISWLQENAEQIADVVIKYNGVSIAAMNESGTKTLQTASTFCESNIEVEYNKQDSGGGGGVVTRTVTVANSNFDQLYYTDAEMNAVSVVYQSTDLYNVPLPVGTLLCFIVERLAPPSPLPMETTGLNLLKSFTVGSRGKGSIYEVIPET